MRNLFTKLFMCLMLVASVMGNYILYISNVDILFPPWKIISLENVSVTRAHFILPLLIQNK